MRENLRAQLHEYGRPLAVYHGRGQLMEASGTKYHCDFAAAQLEDGSIVLLCAEMSAAGVSDVLPVTRMELAEFTGVSDDGTHVKLRGQPQEIDFLGELPEGLFGYAIAFEADELMVEFPTEDRVVAEVRYGLTNFLFEGRSVRVGGIQLEDVLLLELTRNEAGDREESDVPVLTMIRKVPEYKVRARRLMAVKGTAVTAEAVFGGNDPTGVSTLDDATTHVLDQVVHALSYILSVGRGTKVQWVYRELYNRANEPVQRLHVQRVTKRYSPLAPIPALSS